MKKEVLDAIALIKAESSDKSVLEELKKEGIIPEVNVKDAIKLVEGSDEGKDFLTRYTDRKVTQAVNTRIENFKSKDMQDILSEKLKAQEVELTKKLKPELSDAEKRLMETEKKLAELERNGKLSESKASLVKVFANKGLDTDLADFFVSEDKDASVTRATTFAESVQKLVETKISDGVEKAIKDKGYVPPVSKDTGAEVTKDSLAKLADIARSSGRVEDHAKYAEAKLAYENSQTAE